MIGNMKLISNLIIFFIFCAPAFAQPIPPNATVFEILPLFGLPSGLLPSSVQSYTFNSAGDGRFIVVLPKPCYIQFDYLVYYDETITGILKYGSITELKGIEVRRFLVWFDVDEIKVDLPPSDSIYFQIGVIEKRLDIKQFQSVRSCVDDLEELGCGGGGGNGSGGGEVMTKITPVEHIITSVELELLHAE